MMRGWLLLTAVMVLMGVKPAIAATELQLNSDSRQVQDYTLTDGLIKVLVGYNPIKLDDPTSPKENNLTYQIFYNGVLKLSDQETTYYTGSVLLKDLDRNGTPEVIVQSFSGGAHCCTNTLIYNWQNDRFHKTETGQLDGGGGTFKDLNGDGKLEFVSYDQSFLYRFSSYAGSFAPSRIYSFTNGKLIDTTRQYPQFLRSVAWQMYQAFMEHKRDSDREINGILAGYVAQKALLGEFEQGWKLMLANYDRHSDWGLEIHDKTGSVVDRYPDFPTALRAHLKQMGYIK